MEQEKGSWRNCRLAWGRVKMLGAQKGNRWRYKAETYSRAVQLRTKTKRMELMDDGMYDGSEFGWRMSV